MRQQPKYYALTGIFLMGIALVSDFFRIMLISWLLHVPSVMWVVLPNITSAVFWFGWSLVGAAFQPKKSALLGFAFAFILYIALAIIYIHTLFSHLGGILTFLDNPFFVTVFTLMRWPFFLIRNLIFW